MNSYSNKPKSVRILSIEESPLALENLSSFLYDLVLIHDRLFLFLSGNLHYASLSGLPFNRRHGRPIEKSERLQVSIINMRSPLIIQLDLPTAVQIAVLSWTFIMILKVLSDWNTDKAIKRLDRSIKEQQLSRLLRENLEPNNQQHPNQFSKFEGAIIKDIMRLDSNEQISIDHVDDKSD